MSLSHPPFPSLLNLPLMASPHILPFLPSLLLSLRHFITNTIFTTLTISSNPSSFQLNSILQLRSHLNHMAHPPSTATPSTPPHLLLRHPSFLSRNLSIQSISISGNLILLAATTHNLTPALSRPLIFNPLSQTWNYGPPLATPRRWCALGASRGAVYVASGIGTHFSNDVARSMEKWDPNNNGERWERKTCLKDGRFSREAVDAVGWKGKLCMVNVKGDAAKEGVVYDVEEDAWKEMPEGMLSGWRGPVAAMEEEVMYVVDEVKGCLRKYVDEDDAWEEVMESERLKGADQLTAHGGRVCVVSGGRISVVDVVAAPPRLWEVDLPQGFQAVAVLILPRMPVTDFSIQV